MNFIPQRRKAPKMNLKEPGVIRSPGHMKFVRGFACSALGRADHICEGKIEAHHVRAGGNGGTGLKCDDSRCVPLCGSAHKELHDKGHHTFEAKYKLDLEKIAAQLWKVSSHRTKYEMAHRGSTP